MIFVNRDEISKWVRLSCLCNKLARSRGEKESGKLAMDAAIEIVTVFVLKEEAEEKGPRSRRKRDGCGWTWMTVGLFLSSFIKWPHPPSSTSLLTPKITKKPKSGWEHFSNIYLSRQFSFCLVPWYNKVLYCLQHTDQNFISMVLDMDLEVVGTLNFFFVIKSIIWGK